MMIVPRLTHNDPNVMRKMSTNRNHIPRASKLHSETQQRDEGHMRWDSSFRKDKKFPREVVQSAYDRTQNINLQLGTEVKH